LSIGTLRMVRNCPRLTAATKTGSPFPTSCVCLELRPLPSTGVTQLQRYYEPLRHPKAPGLSLAGFQLVAALTTPWGFPERQLAGWDLHFNFATRDRQKAPKIAPLFKAFQRAGPRPENSFLYLLGHIDLASIRASSAP
jgi:hypothetical protein